MYSDFGIYNDASTYCFPRSVYVYVCMHAYLFVFLHPTKQNIFNKPKAACIQKMKAIESLWAGKFAGDMSWFKIQVEQVFKGIVKEGKIAEKHMVSLK